MTWIECVYTLTERYCMRMSNDKDSQYLLRNRPPSEKLVDIGFKSLLVLASMVAVVLFHI